MKLLILLASIAALALTGCASTNTATYKAAKAGVAERALRGPPVGSVSPGTSSDSRVEVLLKSGVTGLAQHEVADYMDRQEAELRLQLSGSGVKTERIGQQIWLIIPAQLTFDTNRSDIRSNLYPVFNDISNVLKTFDKTVIDIIGHTDDTGPYQYNMNLSKARAESVKSYLMAQNVGGHRIETSGMGPNYPVVPNSSEPNRAANRRVEIVLTPLPAPPPNISALLAGPTGNDSNLDAVLNLDDEKSEPDLAADAIAASAQPELVVDADTSEASSETDSVADVADTAETVEPDLVAEPDLVVDAGWANG